MKHANTRLLIEVSVLTLTVAALILTLLVAAGLHHPSYGQNIGGGISTTCNGTDRIYTTQRGGIAVIHGDVSCDSEG